MFVSEPLLQLLRAAAFLSASLLCLLVDSEPINQPSSSSRPSPSVRCSCYGLQPSLAPLPFACWLTPSPSTGPPRPPHHPAIRRASAAAATGCSLPWRLPSSPAGWIRAHQPALLVLTFAEPLLQLLRAAAILGAPLLRPLVDSEPINQPSSSSWLRRASAAAATAIFLGVPLLRLLVDSEPVNRPSSHSSSSCLSSSLFCGCYSKNLGLRAAPPHSSTCSTSGRPSIVFFATAIRRGTLASAPPRPAQRAAGPPLSSSRLLSDMGPWHPRHRGLLNERQALLRLLRHCHPTWHPGIRAAAACSTSGRPSFVFFKTAIRRGTLASAPSRPAQRAAGPPSSSSTLPSDMAPWHPRRRGLLNERRALLRLLQDCHPTWHPGIRAAAACSTSGRPSFVFFDTAIRHGTLASAPPRPAQRAAGPPSSSDRRPTWHPWPLGSATFLFCLLSEQQAPLPPCGALSASTQCPRAALRP